MMFEAQSPRSMSGSSENCASTSELLAKTSHAHRLVIWTEGIWMSVPAATHHINPHHRFHPACGQIVAKIQHAELPGRSQPWRTVVAIASRDAGCQRILP